MTRNSKRAAAGCPPLPEVPFTPEQHAAEASRLLSQIDEQLQSAADPHSLLELAVIALAHGITALAAGTFRDTEPEKW